MTFLDVVKGGVYLCGKNRVVYINNDGAGFARVRYESLPNDTFGFAVRVADLKPLSASKTVSAKTKPSAEEKTNSDYQHILTCPCADCTEWRGFDAENPQVLVYLTTESLYDKGTLGLKEGSIQLYWELLRREVKLGNISVKSSSTYTLFDHHRTRYARAIAVNNPSLMGWFTLMKLECKENKAAAVAGA